MLDRSSLLPFVDTGLHDYSRTESVIRVTHEQAGDGDRCAGNQTARRSPAAGGATFKTSSTVVMPEAIFSAPLTRSGFIPSRIACSRSLFTSVSLVIRLRILCVSIIIS